MTTISELSKEEIEDANQGNLIITCTREEDINGS